MNLDRYEGEFEDLEIISFSDEQIDEYTKKYFSKVINYQIDYTKIIEYANLAIRAKDIAFWLSCSTRGVKNWNFNEKILFFELKKLTNFSYDMKKTHLSTELEIEFFNMINGWIKYYLDFLSQNDTTKSYIVNWQNQQIKNNLTFN